MPFTRHRFKGKDNDRHTSPSHGDEELELPRIYLELNSRVQPTWGPSVEPDAYITDLNGEILLSREGADDELRVGTVSAQSVHLGEAQEAGVPWLDVLDAHSGDTAMYTDLFDSGGSCYSEWIESSLEPFGSDLLILDRIRIKPEYRGRGYGLYAAQLMITGFASGGVVAAFPPFMNCWTVFHHGVPVPARAIVPGRFRVGRLQKPSYVSIGPCWVRASSKVRCIRSVADNPPSLGGDCDARVSCGQAQKEIECSDL